MCVKRSLRPTVYEYFVVIIRNGNYNFSKYFNSTLILFVGVKLQVVDSIILSTIILIWWFFNILFFPLLFRSALTHIKSVCMTSLKEMFYISFKIDCQLIFEQAHSSQIGWVVLVLLGQLRDRRIYSHTQTFFYLSPSLSGWLSSRACAPRNTICDWSKQVLKLAAASSLTKIGVYWRVKNVLNHMQYETRRVKKTVGFFNCKNSFMVFYLLWHSYFTKSYSFKI